MNRFSVFEFASANFRPLQVGQHSDGPFAACRSPAQVLYHACPVFVRPMRVIQARHIHAGADQLVDHFLRGACRAESTDNFGFSDISHDYLVTEKSLTMAKRKSMPF